jgi:hypothetical protein
MMPDMQAMWDEETERCRRDLSLGILLPPHDAMHLSADAELTALRQRAEAAEARVKSLCDRFGASADINE